MQNSDGTNIKSSLPLVEKQNRVALISVSGIGRKTFQKCVEMRRKLECSWDEFWVNKYNILSNCCINEKVLESIKNFTKEYTICSYWSRLMEQNISVIDELESTYPKLLFEIDDRPPILFCKGRIQTTESRDVDDLIWNQKTIAVVGTRKMTSYGKIVTQKIVNELICENIVIVSGFMYGVDVWGQQTAVKGGGKTIAVLGYGFDYIYPRYQKKLQEEMLSEGAVFITEYPGWVPPTPNSFPTRNRIVAGLSHGVLVTEAGEKSGSHITAQCSLNYGREVFAVPGSIYSPYCQGTKELIKQGATFVSSGQEIIEEMGWGLSFEKKGTQITMKNIVESEHSGIDRRIIDCLLSGEKHQEELKVELNCEASCLSQAISMLEVQGKITNNNGFISINI